MTNNKSTSNLPETSQEFVQAEPDQIHEAELNNVSGGLYGQTTTEWRFCTWKSFGC